MPEISSIAQFGVAGMAVFLMYKISANHIEHNTEVLEKLTEAIIRLEEWLKNNP